ncbi:hypothetical protein D3C85_1701000 [compost metagenome]
MYKVQGFAPGPGAVLLGTPRKEHGQLPITGFDLFQYLRDVEVFIDQQCLDAESLQVFDSQVLLAALVVV